MNLADHNNDKRVGFFLMRKQFLYSMRSTLFSLFLLVGFGGLNYSFADPTADLRKPIRADLFVYSPLLDTVSEEEIRTCFDYAAEELANAADIHLTLNKIERWNYSQGVIDAFAHWNQSNHSYSSWVRLLDEMDTQLNGLRSADSMLRIGFIQSDDCPGNEGGRTRVDKPNAYIFTTGKSLRRTRMVLLHEITHLFGAVDLKNTGTLMDDAFLSREEPMPVLFEPAHRAIMKLAWNDIQ